MKNAYRGYRCCAGMQNNRDDHGACVVMVWNIENGLTAGRAVPYNSKHGGNA